MRSYINTMIFEGSLDFITPGTDLEAMLNTIFTPKVKVIEAQCNTFLGDRVNPSFDLLGRTELATGFPIDSVRLSAVTANTQDAIPCRSLFSCISPGGICQACFQASRPLATAPAVGSLVNILPQYIIQREHIVVTPGTTTMTMQYSTEEYDTAYVFTDGTLLIPAQYTISGNTLTIPAGVPLDGVGGVGTVTIWYATVTRSQFVYWLAGTYSGSLMGMSPLPHRPFPVRKSLFTSLIPVGTVELLAQNCLNSDIIPQAIKDYLPQIKDLAEKAVLVSMLNAVYFQ